MSTPYLAAMAAALAEHALEAAFCPPGWTPPAALSAVGACLALGGQALRWAAILWAGPSFSHAVALAGSPKRAGHALVTSGPYGWARHPAYLGWTAWAVGCAGTLGCPGAAALFGGLALRFFRARVRAEEAGLVALFGAEYEAYRARTRTWMPGVP